MSEIVDQDPGSEGPERKTDRTFLVLAGVVTTTVLAIGAALATLQPLPDAEPAPLDAPLVEVVVAQRAEEGRVGTKDAKVDTGKVRPALKQQLDREVAETAGTLSALREESSLDAVLGSSGLSDDMSSGIGGLIGAKGTQVGSGGLAMRGTGLGGGGATAGFGAFGRGSYAGENRRDADALPRAAGGEGYRDPGVNPMTLAAEDRLSTFATDVDTGSFTLARRMLLEEGRLPTPAGVRVEEFVNYPKWDYPTPTDGAPVAVNLEAAPHPWQAGHHLLRVGLRADDLDGERPAANLVFLVDVSGSMQGPDRLPRARTALHTLVSSLRADDSVALVTYAGSTGIALEPTPGDQKARIHAAIDALSSGGGTAMGAGVDLAYGLAERSLRKGRENRVIVLSDGDANIGRATPEALLDQIARYAGKGITLSTVGFGVGNYQDAMMEQFANKGDGNYFYVDSLGEAERIFTQDLAGTVQTIARDVKVQIDFDPRAVHAWRLVGYENRDVADQDFRKDKVDGGEMGSGHRVTVLYDLVLAKAPEGPLATVSFRAKKPGVDTPAREWRTTLDARAIHESFTSATADFRAVVGVAGFAELLRKSPYAGELTWQQVASILEGAHRAGREDGDVERMVQKARAFAGLTADAR
ncbi:MAG: von Willebrand factor type A domain-containing protein [Pseudomonadota bacterium]|nr:von Willebrand factor type A domain-containing protein [Pseudomonadota bacterium]